jgi:hypothetical protein
MISSSDELELLIKKWVNESIQIGVCSTIKGTSGRRAVLYVEGKPHLDEHTKHFGVLGQGKSLAVLNLADCTFGYVRLEDRPELAMTDIISQKDLIQPARYDEFILVRWPEGATAVIMTLKEESSTRS